MVAQTLTLLLLAALAPLVNKMTTLTPIELTDKQYINGPDTPLRSSQPLTEANLVRVLQHLGCTLRYNVMTGTVEYVAGGRTLNDLDQDRAYIAIMDTLKMVDIKALGGLDFMLLTISRQDSYHPMQEWLAGLPDPGDTDWLGLLTDSITTDSELWPVFIENWLIQVVEGVCTWSDQPRGLPHVLTLVGGQGLGKTRWLENLGGAFIKTEAELHLSSSAGKDHQIAALKHPMVELSELDGIFRKADVSHMKAFISRPWDEIREPYAKKAVGRPRMTSFCASVNDAEFLNDPSGSRRFWPVQVEEIDWDFEMDWDGLWAQMYALWQDSADFMLTAEEDRLRAEVSLKSHTTLSPEVEKVAAFWDAHKHLKSDFQPMNRTEILEMLGYRHPHAGTAKAVGLWLIENVGRLKTLSGKQRSVMFPYNEFGTDLQSWPKNTHLNQVDQ